MEQTSTGWALSDTANQNLSKAECNVRLNDLLARGANPTDIRAILQDDTRYDNRPPLT